MVRAAMTHRRELSEQRRLPGPKRSRAFSESSAILALFALFLNLFAAFLPPPALAAFNGSDAAVICSSGGTADDGGTPPAPARHHHCQDCLAQQIGGNANLPAPAPALLRLPAAAPLIATHDQVALPLKQSAKAQPRAPPAFA
jgi:hypothetical protein